MNNRPEMKAREVCNNLVPDAQLEARGLPQFCFVQHPHRNEIVMLRRGQLGYYKPLAHLVESGTVTADELNQSLGVTKAQAEAMRCGSIFGFHTPGADPKVYEGRFGGVPFSSRRRPEDDEAHDGLDQDAP